MSNQSGDLSQHGQSHSNSYHYHNQGQLHLEKKQLSLDATSSEGGSVTLEVFTEGGLVGSLVYHSNPNKYEGTISNLASNPSEVVVISTGGG